ncbi:MAG: DUF3426 domain-containing protein [Gallionella sp.]|nr:DUF3426 domain-containing protein [Gallionella sp.]
MLGTSICPHCKATYEIGETQINAHLGLVRCETCLELFDFRISYVPAHHDPQLEMPLSEDHPAIKLHSSEDRIYDALAAARQREIFGDEEWVEARDDGIEFAVADDIHEPMEEVQPSEQLIEPTITHEPLAENALLSGIEIEDPVDIPPDIEYAFAKKSYRVWPWTAGVCLTVLTLLFQGAYFFRVEIAAHFPPSKPALEAACRVLECTVDLPQQADLMSIESSSLADTPQKNVVLSALLRNHAGYAQAFPSLELTLTDGRDQPVASRLFKPVDYLPPAENETIGLLPNRELNLKLYLDTADIKPSGYRLLLLYPQ